jgi:competence protein ComEC
MIYGFRWSYDTYFYPLGDTSFQCVIAVHKEKEYTHQYLCQSGLKKIVVYHNDLYEVGDKVSVTGTITPIDHPTLPSSFDYHRYLRANRISGVVFSDDMVFIEKTLHPNLIKEWVQTYIETHTPSSQMMIKTFILADKSDFDDTLSHAITTLGISHLFAVSGMHIALLVLMIEYGFKKIHIKPIKRHLFISIVLIIYCMITSFAASIVRASLMVVLMFVNNRLKTPFSTMDVISFVFIILLLIHPYYYLDIGFQLSFLVTFFLIITQPFIVSFDKEYQLVVSSFVAFSVTVPIIVSLNHSINLMTILVNIVFIPLTSLIIVPLGYITFIVPFFDTFYALIIQLYNVFIIQVSQVMELSIRPTFNHSLIVVVYYVILYLLFSFERSKQLYMIGLWMLFLILNAFMYLVNPITTIAFIDIEGEATLFKDRFNQCTVVIDTGQPDEYDTLVQYLFYHQVHTIDYLIISHYHSDHYGETNDVLSVFDVTHLVTNDNVSAYENQLIKCGDFDLYFYPLSLESHNENNHSIPVSIWALDTHYFLMGDAERLEESWFINTYNINVDVLKINHHGSDTSSTTEFIDALTPSVAYINVDRDNRHGHPSIDVVNQLKERGITIYRTDLQGTIEFNCIFGLTYKKNYPP